MKRLALRIIIFILIASGVAVSGILQDAQELCSAAEQFYVKGSYDKALAIYDDLIASGNESGAIYYNAGNCCLQQELTGRAIYYYEMARRFIPRDTELLVNLRYARSLMKQPDVPSGELLITNILRRTFDRLTLKESFGVMNAAYFGCAILLVLSFFLKTARNPLRIIATVLFLLVLTLLVPLRSKILFEERTGVVTAPIIDARYEPFEDAAAKFPLYEGMEVQVLKVAQQWYKIKRADNKVGWVSKTSLSRFKTSQ